MSKRLPRRTVYFTPKHYTAEQYAALARACAAINAACGREVFAVRLSPPSRHVVLFTDAPFGDDPDCIAYVEMPKRSWIIAVRPALTAEHLMVALLHELGHILGLGHAKKPESVMCATPEPRANAFDWVAHAAEIAHRAGVISAAAQRAIKPRSVPVRQAKRVLSHRLSHNKAQRKAS